MRYWRVEIALVLYTGVAADECSAFRSVLERLPGARVVGVGRITGSIAGPGGVQSVESTYDDVPRPDVVIVPGGLGCGRVAADPELRHWLERVAPTCRWMVGSSTGSVVLAAAGLLDGTPAVTHWLAGRQLDRYGIVPSDAGLTVSGNRMTCEGRITAVAAAYAIVTLCAGAGVADDIRRQLVLPPGPTECRPTRRRQRRHRLRSASGTTAALPPEPVLVELVVTEPDDARRHRRKRFPDTRG